MKAIPVMFYGVDERGKKFKLMRVSGHVAGLEFCKYLMKSATSKAAKNYRVMFPDTENKTCVDMSIAEYSKYCPCATKGADHEPIY